MRLWIPSLTPSSGHFSYSHASVSRQRNHVRSPRPASERDHPIRLKRVQHVLVTDQSCPLTVVIPFGREDDAVDSASLAPFACEEVCAARTAVAECVDAVSAMHPVECGEEFCSVAVVAASADEEFDWHCDARK